jgi:radical SAM protein
MNRNAVIAGLGHSGHLDFNRRPLLVFWETTRACLLACKHCRASAVAEPVAGQLTPDQGLALLEQVMAFGKPYPILVLTGGDVLMRPDAYELAASASSLGIPTCLAPSVTPMLTPDALGKFVALGVKAVSISLDGSRAETHEGVRGISGHFDRTQEAIRRLVEAGLRVQVNTTVMSGNVDEMADVASLVAKLGAQIWEVFFLVGIGRGAKLAELDPTRNEDVCHFLFDASRHGFVVRTVEAPFFRRVAAWRRAREEQIGRPETLEEVQAAFGLGETYVRLRRRLDQLLGEGRRRPAAHTVATRDGKGIVFVAHDGEVYPAGFLPLGLGNVKEQSLVDIYRESTVLRRIRAGAFTGRCGICPFRDLCGGSRARAFVSSGDPLDEDPGCPYRPSPMIPPEAAGRGDPADALGGGRSRENRPNG